MYFKNDTNQCCWSHTFTLPHSHVNDTVLEPRHATSSMWLVKRASISASSFNVTCIASTELCKVCAHLVFRACVSWKTSQHIRFYPESDFTYASLWAHKACASYKIYLWPRASLAQPRQANNIATRNLLQHEKYLSRSSKKINVKVIILAEEIKKTSKPKIIPQAHLSLSCMILWSSIRGIQHPNCCNVLFSTSSTSRMGEDNHLEDKHKQHHHDQRKGGREQEHCILIHNSLTEALVYHGPVHCFQSRAIRQVSSQGKGAKQIHAGSTIRLQARKAISRVGNGFRNVGIVGQCCREVLDAGKGHSCLCPN